MMKIVLTGVETNNKGAELMLYAILQEIERKWPDSEVYLSFSQIKQGLKYVKTNLKLRLTPFSCIVQKLYLEGIFWKLHLPQEVFAKTYVVKDADILLDGSGFAFGDQWNYMDCHIKHWETKLKPLYEKGCRIIFLPQAFGPVEKPNTRKILAVLNNYADLVMPREQMSYDYIKGSGVVDMKKVKIYKDFTSLVEGVFPPQYAHLRNGICIIPNMQMIRMNKISHDDYLNLLAKIILEGQNSGHPVYLLNHEGKNDEELCKACQQHLNGNISVVTELNALEVKGLIASSYLVITSRFHGLVSSLNSGVPGLATSWNHKYEELFDDYGLDGYILPLDDIDKSVSMVQKLLCKDENERIRKHLNEYIPRIKEQTKEMWRCVWDVCKINNKE